MLTILVYAGLLISLVYFLLLKHFSYWESKGVPHDKPSLIFGNFYNVAIRKEHVFDRICAIYNKIDAPYVGIFIFFHPRLILRSPELIKKILVKDFDKFSDRNFASNESVDPIAFHSLFSARGKTWKALRQKLSPVFTSGKIRMMLPLMRECAENLNEYLAKHEGSDVEIKYLLKKFAVDVISSCAFGINSNCLKNDNSEIRVMASRLVDFDNFVRSLSVFSFFFAPRLVDIFRLKFLDKTASDFMQKVFKITLRERERNRIERHDLIDLLNNLKKSGTINDEYKFDDVKMASQAITFFSAGNDTTSLTISHALYELAIHEDIQGRLRKEVTEIFGKYREFSYEAIQEMKYMDMVLSECLRKHPVITSFDREALVDYPIEGTDFTIAKGTTVVIPVCGLHHDPKYYPDPEKFDPERFSEENKSNIKPYTYLPFGDGPRTCIGQRFGLLVSKVALAYTIKSFAFELSENISTSQKLDTKSLFLQNEGGIHLKVLKI